MCFFCSEIPSKSKSHAGNHLSNENNLGCLGYFGDYTTQLYRDYNKPLSGSLFTNQTGLCTEATYGAFVCFKQASEGGGEFLIADGAKILEDMDPEAVL